MGALTNLSGCSNGVSSNISVAINVHSSLFKDNYPSYIVLHSLETQVSNIEADVYDATTGSRIGGVIFRNVPGNASGIITVEDVEETLGYTPTPTQLHYNIVLRGNSAAYIQHQLDNEKAGFTTNMTPTCAM